LGDIVDAASCRVSYPRIWSGAPGFDAVVGLGYDGAPVLPDTRTSAFLGVGHRGGDGLDVQKLSFLKQFARSPRTIGAVAPSSAALAEVITETAGVREAEVVVEFGPGTGVFTEVIARKLPPNGRFLAVERTAQFIDPLRARCPAVTVVHDSATNTERRLAAMGLNHCDCIVSGLPWATFDDRLQDELLEAVEAVLRPGGRFVTFAYLQGALLPAGKRFRRKLADRFGRVDRTPTVWWNLPPAFVYYVTTAAPGGALTARGGDG